MKFLAFGDLEGNTNLIRRLLKLDLGNYDFLLYLGDMPDPSVFKTLREAKVSKGINEKTDIEKELVKNTMPYKALKKATDEVVEISSLLRQVSIPIYGVLGNADLQYYSQFVDWPFISLHKKTVKLKGLNLIGYNGRPLYVFEKENKNENAFSEEDIEDDLNPLFSKVNCEQTIFVTHAPAYQVLDRVEKKMRQYATNTYGNRAKNGNIGSTGIKKIVERYKPFLHIFGHIHENEGKIRKSKTLFVNTGSLNKSQSCFSFFIQNKKVTVSRLKLKLV